MKNTVIWQYSAMQVLSVLLKFRAGALCQNPDFFSRDIALYRVSPPYTHFGTWKKLCYMKFLLVGLYCGPLLMLKSPTCMYRVFKLDMIYFKHLLGHQKCNFKS